MLSSNETPFAAVGFGDLHRDGMTMAVVCVRATYNLSAEGSLSLSGSQEIMYSDVYADQTEFAPLLHASDLIGYKPAADVTVLGYAHAPGGKPAESWTVAIGVGRYGAALRVHGPRQWEPTLKRLRPTWKLGPSEPVARVPLDYRLASGGRYAGDPEGDSDRRNLIGPGLLHPDWTPHGRPLRAPQIDSEDAPVGDPFGRPEPQGFGPVPPFWRWREQHMGTRDETWQRHRLPQPPSDFDYRSEQVAHPNLVLSRLVGDETVALRGLLPGIRRLDFAPARRCDPGASPLVRRPAGGRAPDARRPSPRPACLRAPVVGRAHLARLDRHLPRLRWRDGDGRVARRGGRFAGLRRAQSHRAGTRAMIIGDKGLGGGNGPTTIDRDGVIQQGNAVRAVA